jgi:hypothetical protein
MAMRYTQPITRHPQCASKVNSELCDEIAGLFKTSNIPHVAITCPCGLTHALTVGAKFLDAVDKLCLPVRITRLGIILVIVPH